jgi:polyhydroxybutyrate depolymerase
MRTIAWRLIGVLATVTLLLVTAAAVPADAGGRDGGGSGGGGGHSGDRCLRSLPTGVQTIQVRFGGSRYAVRLVVPAGIGSRTSLPLVLDLHGSSSNGVAQAPISDLTTLAGQEKFLVANPSGAIALAPQNPPLPDGSWAWNVPGVPTTAGAFPPADARDDVQFLAAVIKTVDRLACVDDDRVYATGFSGGGRMASALACELAGTIAAVAPVAGLRAGRPSPVDTTVPEIQDCTPSRPVPVITFHGDADLVNPLPGNGDLRWGYAVSVAVQSWARLNGCQNGPASRAVSEHVVLFTYSRCRSRADVAYYRVTGGGHTWPGTAVDLSPLGPTTQEIDATELMWEFFEAHPKR